MRTEGKVSKVAICNNCKGFVLASHIDYINKQTDKEFTELSNEGFTVELITIEDTKKREFSSYETCSKGLCVNNDK